MLRCFTCSFIDSFLILHFSSAHPHTYTSSLAQWLMKNLAIKGLPTACDLDALSVTCNSNNTRNPFIQLHRAAWWNYSQVEKQIFHCSPCFTYLSAVILLRWVCPVFLKNPPKSLCLYFKQSNTVLYILTLWEDMSVPPAASVENWKHFYIFGQYFILHGVHSKIIELLQPRLTRFFFA